MVHLTLQDWRVLESIAVQSPQYQKLLQRLLDDQIKTLLLPGEDRVVRHAQGRAAQLQDLINLLAEAPGKSRTL